MELTRAAQSSGQMQAALAPMLGGIEARLVQVCWVLETCARTSRQNGRDYVSSSTNGCSRAGRTWGCRVRAQSGCLACHTLSGTSCSCSLAPLMSLHVPTMAVAIAVLQVLGMRPRPGAVSSAAG